MILKIEIHKMYNNKLEMRVGDLSGSTELSNFTKKEILSEISDEIDTLMGDLNE